MQLIVVTGTGTEIGKTYVSCALITHLRERGLCVAARKPLQSYEESDLHTDASLLATATGEPVSAVCPPEGCYPVPMAPPMAAGFLQREVPSNADLAARLSSSWAAGTDVGLVEGAGGVLSPLSSDGSTADLISALKPAAVVIVADARLGTINLVRLTAKALGAARAVVYLNRYEEDEALQVANRDWLVADGYAVTTSVGELAACLLGGSFV